MPSPGGRLPAVTFRRKVFVGEHHKDAIDLAFSGMSDLTVHRVARKIADGKLALVFGYAHKDGSGFIPIEGQAPRLTMYGFE